jgi:hypothetical protein
LQLIYDLLRQKDVEIKIQKDMKQYLIAIAMMLTLSLNAGAVAQNHRHTPRTEQVDSTKNNQDAIEAFSDTTANDTTYSGSYATRRSVNVTLSDDDFHGMMNEVFSHIGGKEITGIAIVLGTLFILFVLFPIVIIIGVVYFINRNRKERLKLAQMAMEKGQPIPEQLLKEEARENSDDYQKGLRQMFTGVGLAIFLGIVAGTTGFGIGALVFFIGLGKWYIARQSGNTGNASQVNHTINNSDNDNLNNSEL